MATGEIFVGEGGDLDRGSFVDGWNIQWVHGLDPCTISFFGCPLSISSQNFIILTYFFELLVFFSNLLYLKRK
jgi:hypothetical protein